MVRYTIILFLFPCLLLSQDSIVRKINDLNNKANSYLINQKYKEAHLLFQKALELSSENNKTDLVVKTKASLGNYYLFTGNNSDAKKIFNEIKVNKALSDSTKCFVFHRKAFYHNQTLNLDSAVFYSQKALKIALTNNFTTDKATIYNELGSIYDKKGNFNKASFYYKKSLETTENIGNYDYCNTYYNLAKIDYNNGNYKQSIERLKENLNLLKSKNWLQLKSQIHIHLGLNYFRLKDSLSGYKHKTLAYHFQNEIARQRFNEDYQNLLTEFKTREKDELLKKQKEKFKLQWYILSGAVILLILLTLVIYRIRFTNKSLKKLSRENTFLLEEVNHRIKNNLQLIVSLLNRETSKQNQPDEINSLTNISLKIESIASLHQLLYTNEEKKEIELNLYFLELVKNIEHLLQSNQIKLNTDFEHTNINSNTALYLGLIFNELIFNSIKHAFSNISNKKINISIIKEGNNLFLNYTDNGCGYVGKAPKLITLLSKQINAETTINSKNKFSFKLNIKL